MNRSTALAKPSSSFEAVIRRAIAAPACRRCPWRCSAPSGRTSICRLACLRSWRCFGGDRVPGGEIASDHPLVGVGMGDIDVVGLGARRRDMVAELVVGGAAARSTRAWSSLTPTILTMSSVTSAEIAADGRPELDCRRLLGDVRALRVGDQPVGALVQPDVDRERRQADRRSV